VLGTVYPVKNPVRVVEAAALLRDRGAGEFHIDWYGRRGLMGDEVPSDDYRAAVARAEELGLGAHVTFHGQVTDVAKALREANALLHVSLQEGFPNAVVEGMASGLPLVVSRVSDLPLVVAEAHNGTVVDQLSPASIADGMLRIMSTPEAELAAMGQRSRDLAAVWFGHERFVSDFEALYARLVDGGQVGRREP
jgi:glycosyltransferase involved in cell wall biosynthesis